MNNELNNKQQAFIRHYIESNFNATKAAKLAGYSQKTAYSQGHDLLKKPEIKKAIDDELHAFHEQQKKRFIKASEIALEALIDVAQSGLGSSRVQAANSLLDRAGHKPIDHLKVKAEVTNQNPLDEISEDKRNEAILDAAESLGAIIPSRSSNTE